MEKVGSLTLCDTAAYESLHHILTRVAGKNPQFVYILKSCAERHQMTWAQSWTSEKFHTFSTGIQKLIRLNMQDVISFPNEMDWNEEVPRIS